MVLTVTFTKTLYFSPVELVVVSDVLVVSDVVVVSKIKEQNGTNGDLYENALFLTCRTGCRVGRASGV